MSAVLQFPRQRPYVVEQRTQLQRVVAKFASRKTRIYADTETTGLNHLTGKLVAVQIFQDGAEVPVVIDWRCATDAWAADMNQLRELCWVFHNAAFDLKWMWAAGVDLQRVYDTQIAEQVIFGIGPDERSDDDPDMQGLRLADLVRKYAGVDISKDEREWFFSPAPLDERPEWGQPFPESQVWYMGNDVIHLPTVMAGQRKVLEARKLMPTAALEMRVIPALAQMEINGVHVDAEAWRAVIADKEAETQQLEAELLDSKLANAILNARRKRFDEQTQLLGEWQIEHGVMEQTAKEVWTILHEGQPLEEDLALYGMLPDEGEKWGDFKKRVNAAWKVEHPRPATPDTKLKDLNFGSSQQLIEGLQALGVKLPTKYDRKTKERKPTTEAEALEKLSEKYPVLKPYLAWRQARKMVSTYGERVLQRIGPDGRIHPSYNQMVSTGRMSCRLPNWQNIPARTEDGKRLRLCCQAEDGNQLLVCDFPNIEMRILADLSNNQPMLEMFASGADMHCFTARRMFNLPADMTDDEVKSFRLPNGLKARDIAKTINFGIAYGQSAKGFAAKFNVDEATAQGFIELYYQTFDGLKEWMAAQAEFAVKNDYSLTALGRRRYYRLGERPNYREDYEGYKEWGWMCEAVKRQGMNAPIQGSSADITKLAVSMFHEWARLAYPGTVRLVAVVHDEMVVEAPEELAGTQEQPGIVATMLAGCMLKAAKTYLKRVDIHISAADVHIGKAWEH